MQVSRRRAAASLFRFVFSLALSATAFSGAFLSQAAALPRNDFDGDGYSDVALVSIEGSGALDWNIISGQSSSSIKSKNGFGVAGNHLTPALWYRAHAALGFVSLNGTQILWNVLKDDGTSVQKVFGVKGDITVSGGDFDGNGVADAATITTLGDGRYQWVVRRNLFSPSSRAVQIKNGRHILTRRLPASSRAVFGKSGDIPFFADPDRYGDWMGIVKNGGKSFYLRNIYTGRTKKIALRDFTAGALGAFPLKQAAGGDLLLFPIRGASTTDLYVTTAAGALVAHSQINSAGEILIGNFTDAANAQVAIQSGSSYTIFSPLTQQTETKSYGAGIAADAININLLSSNAAPTPAPGSGGGGVKNHADNPPPPAGSFTAVCPHLHPMDRTVLYKPGSGGTADARTGKPAFLWYDCLDQGVENLWVVASNGAQIGKFELYPVVCPLVRFYSGYGSGTGDTGSELMNKARAASGSQNIYFYTKDGNCWGPVTNANGRSGGR